MTKENRIEEMKELIGENESKHEHKSYAEKLHGNFHESVHHNLKHKDLRI